MQVVISKEFKLFVIYFFIQQFFVFMAVFVKIINWGHLFWWLIIFVLFQSALWEIFRSLVFQICPLIFLQISLRSINKTVLFLWWLVFFLWFVLFNRQSWLHLLMTDTTCYWETWLCIKYFFLTLRLVQFKLQFCFVVVWNIMFFAVIIQFVLNQWLLLVYV